MPPPRPSQRTPNRASAPTSVDPPRARRSDRAPVELDIVFQSRGQPLRFATLTNLSAGGACVMTNKPCDAGDAVTMQLPWPSRDEPTELTALVRWVEGRQMGVQFTMATPAALDAIASLGTARGLRGDERPRRRDAAEPTGFSRDELLAAPTDLHANERRVRFQEVDAAGTIYYSRVFEYFGDIYLELLERDGLSVPRVMNQREWFAPLVHAEADYLAPMRFGDVVRVAVAKVRCGGSSATIGYRIASREGRPLAVGHTVHVFVDGSTFRPCPIPPDVRRALVGDEGGGG